MSSVFVTATDTDAGKSFVTAALVGALIEAGCDAGAIKPVSCGHGACELNADVATLLAAQGMGDERAGEINLYDYAAYAAPMFAARSASEAVNLVELAGWCRRKAGEHALTLIEGVGGLMVPLATGVLVSDWLDVMLESRVLLVVRARLGGMNHALLTLDKLQRMGRGPDWVVVNAADKQGDAMRADHRAAIEPLLDTSTCLLELPWLPEAGAARAHLRGSPLFVGLEDLAS